MGYLDRGDWKKVLDKKEHSSIKKTGMSEVLEGYEKAKKKDDKGGMVLALQEVREKAESLKSKYAKVKTMADYLDQMVREARLEQEKVKAALDVTEDDDLDGSGSSLADGLARVKKSTSDTNRHNFALAPSKVSSGLVVSKKATQRSHIKAAMEMRGKPGVYFTGSCWFESGKYYFEFPEAPPAGMAKSIRQAARLHAELGIKVTVRGGGVEYDDDTDPDFEEAGEGKAASGGAASYPKRDAVDPIIAKVLQLPPAKREDALSGTVGRFNLLRGQAVGDADLDDTTRAAVLVELDAALKKLHIAGSVPPTRKAYPTESDWVGLLDRCMRLDAAKRQAGIDALGTKLAEVAAQVGASTSLTDAERKAELALLDKVVATIRKAWPQFAKVVAGAGASDLGARLKALETDFDQARRQGVLPTPIQDDLLRAIMAARGALARNDTSAGDAIDTLEAKIKAALSVAFAGNVDLGKRRKQDALYNSVAPGVALAKKASFAPGMADMLFRDANGLVMDDRLAQIADEFRACEKKADAAALTKLATTAQTYLWDVLDTIDGLDQTDPQYEASRKGLEAKGKAARDAVQRVRLVELADRIEAVGPPPWDDAKTERMTELQIAFFFEEGAIKRGAAEFGAPALASDATGPAAGVNAAWWIKRAAPNGEGGETERTYIFKPQVLEATSFVGMPDKGGSVREVMAAELSDALVAAGFDVGVCPTHLVEIDSAKLGDLPKAAQGPARTLGAVQQLADNDGSLGKALAEDPDALIKTIDHKNLSDIAVFDLMFLNLDRHSGNLLLKKGPDGKNKVIPIDHGIGMPDADGLVMNRARMTGAQNVLYSDALRSNEPIAAETLANLKRIDARALAAGMAKKQQELEARHPDSKGKLDPAEYDRMASRIEFMQAAAGIMTSKQMTEAIANHSVLINKTAAADMPKLAIQLKAKIEVLAKAKAEIELYVPPGTEPKSRFDLLQGLGWCVGLVDDAMAQWEKENADLVLRILRGKIENPAAIKERDRLKTALGTAEVAALKLDGKTLGAQVLAMRARAKIVKNKTLAQAIDAADTAPDARAAFLATPQVQKDLADLRAFRPKLKLDDDAQKMTQLRVWARIKAAGGPSELAEAHATFPEQKEDSLAMIASLLEALQDFKAMGGMKAYLALNGQSMGAAVVQDRNTMFRELIANQTGGAPAGILALDEKRMQEVQDAAFARESKAIYAKLANVIRRERQRDLFAAYQKCQSDYKAGQCTPAHANLTHLAAKVDAQIGWDVSAENELKQVLAELRSGLAEAQKDRPELDLSKLADALENAAGLIPKRDLTPAERALNRIKLALDEMVKGAGSLLNEYRATLKDHTARAAKLRGAVAGKEIDQWLAEAKAFLIAYDLTDFVKLSRLNDGRIKRAEKYQALQAKAKTWQATPEEKAKFAAHAVKIEKALIAGDAAAYDGLVASGRERFPTLVTAEFS